MHIFLICINYTGLDFPLQNTYEYYKAISLDLICVGYKSKNY